MVFESNTLDFLWLQDGKQGSTTESGLYTWVKYSHNSDGSNMSDDPTDMEYMGIAYNKTDRIESEDPSDYEWCKIKGDPGESGTDAYTIILDNENISFATSSLKIPLNDQTATCKVTVFQGTQERKDFLIGEITSPVGISVKTENKVIYLSVSSSTAIGSLSGEIDIPIQIDGIDFTKKISYSLAVKGEDGDSPVSVYLSNENHTFSATSDGKAISSRIQTYVYAYYGSTQVSATIGNISTKTGIKMDIVNNGQLNTFINISVDSTLTQSDTVDIPVLVGENTYHCTFSYTLSPQGADGSPAKSIDITASSQVFKSTDGGTTFSPDTISLTPRFQGGISYSKWEYSINGGKTWSSITSSTNGVSISSGILSVSKASMLYTKEITSVVFKCISSDSKFYDTCTISKIYDVIDIRESIDTEFTEVKNTISGIDQKVDKANKSITDKVWQSDITETVNNYDNTTVKKVRDRVTTVEQDISTINSTVQDMQTTVNNKADGSTVTELTNRVSKAEQDASSFKQTVEKTYAKQTDLDDLTIGGRNLILNGKGNEKLGLFKNFNNVTDEYAEFTLKSKKQYSNINIADGFSLGCRDYEVGETYTWSYDIMYTVWNFPTGTNHNEFWFGQRYTSAPSGQTGTGTWVQVTAHTLPIVGTDGCELNKWYHVEKTITIPNQASSNVGAAASIQFYNSSNTEASFTARMKNVKLEKGDKATDWTPAPEDVDESIKNVNEYAKTSFEQLSDKFSWIVESNSSQTSLTLTDSLISAVTKQFVIKDSSGSATIIEGGKIKANSITAKMLSTTAITSTNYQAETYTNGAGYSKKGTFIDLSNGMIHTPSLYTDNNGDLYINGHIVAKSLTLNADVSLGEVSSNETGFYLSKNGLLQASNAMIYGTIYASNGEFSGKIIANEGNIGGCHISDKALFCLNKSMSSAGIGDDVYAFWAGGEGTIEENPDAVGSSSSSSSSVYKYNPNIDDAPFRVTYDGKVYLDNGEIVATSIAAKEKYQISCLIKDHDETKNKFLSSESIISGFSYKYHDYSTKELYNYNRVITFYSPEEISERTLEGETETYTQTPSASISLESKRINNAAYGESSISLSADSIVTHSDLYLGDETIDKKIFTLHGNVAGNASTASNLLISRTLKIGNTGKSFNGSENVSWSLTEIGAAPSSHSHDVLISSDYNLIFTSSQNFYARKESNKSNGVANIGVADARFKTLYLTGNVNSSSDRNDKLDIQDLDEKYENMYMDLRPVTYMWDKLSDDDNAVHDRIHCGLIAQEVNDAAIKNGLSSITFAGICRDKLDTPLSDGRTEKWGLAYNEFTAITIKMVQNAIKGLRNLDSELDKLKQENKQLKERLSAVEQFISQSK